MTTNAMQQLFSNQHRFLISNCFNKMLNLNCFIGPKQKHFGSSYYASLYWSWGYVSCPPNRHFSIVYVACDIFEVVFNFNQLFCWFQVSRHYILHKYCSLMALVYSFLFSFTIATMHTIPLLSLTYVYYSARGQQLYLLKHTKTCLYCCTHWVSSLSTSHLVLATFLF